MSGAVAAIGGWFEARAGHAARQRAAGAAALLGGLLAADRDAGVGALVRLELLRGRLGLREIDLGGDGGAQVVVADDRLEQLEDPLGVAALDLVHVLQLSGVEPGAVAGVGAAGEERAGLVEHAHRLRVELGHAGGHQVDDAGDLRPVERAAGMQRQQHRGGGLLLLAKEPVLVRQREVHAGALHRGERADRARELAFESALEGEPLLELGLAEAGAVHQLEAGDRALGQAGGGHLQAQVGHLRRRDHDRAAALLHLVGHVHRRELGDDGAAVLVGQVGVEHLVVALAGVHRQRQADADQRGDADAGTELGARRHRRDAPGEAGRNRHRQRGVEGDSVVH